MNANFCFAICSFFYIILIVVMYFSKERLKNTENKIYSVLLIVTLVGVGLEISSTVLELTANSGNIIHDIILKLIMLYYISWIFVFYVYIYYISKDNKQINFKPFYILYAFLALLTLLLPLHAHMEGTLVLYTYGLSVDFVYMVSGIFIVFCIGLMIKNIRQIKKQKYIPLFAFMGVGIVVTLTQLFIPSLLLMSTLETFIAVLMFHTVENPDIKMLEELYKNKKIIEKNNENTSNFLFKISQSIKSPVRKIIDKTNNDKNLIEINNLGKELEYVIDDVLDVTKMTTKSLKLYTAKYNPRNLFDGIKSRAQNGLSNDITLRYKVSPDIPNYVYGDSIKLKQVLTSVLDNSIYHTENGFIEFEINTIIKYGICRFIIDITDSGKGISIDRVNDILSLEESLDKIDDEQITLNLKEVKAVVEKLGGYFMIKSDEKMGTTVSITIDQKIVETEDEELQKKLEMYEEILYKNKKIMVIDDDAKELSEIACFLEKNNATVHRSLFGKDIVFKISNKNKYDLIILDDEMSNESALSILQELKKDENFNIPVVVMINDNKEFIKLHYLKDGFADTISKSKLKEELLRILKRF